MKNKERFKKLVTDQYDGMPWLDVTIQFTLDGINANDAAKNIAGLNSIWQIINHLTNWRLTLIKRMKDKKAPSPEDNFFSVVTDTSEEAWIKSKKDFERSQKKLLKFLSVSGSGQWDHKPAKGGYSRFELMAGILQHDAYHLGQVVLIKKLLAQGL